MYLSQMRSRLPKGTILRAMAPIGSYWRESIYTETAAYIVRDDLIFTATHFNIREADYYSEFEEPLPEEIQLLASLALAVGFDRGMLTQYPSFNSVRVAEQQDLRDNAECSRLEEVLRAALLTDEAVPNCPSDPPASYRYFHWPNPVAVQKEIHKSIDPADDLLIRGLGTWLKAAMLNLHPMFCEEANYPLWISLDASLNMVLHRLAEKGFAQPSTTDAQNFIHEAFGEEQSGLRYFEDYYVDRIRTVHPKNRYGITKLVHCHIDTEFSRNSSQNSSVSYPSWGSITSPS